MAESARQFWQDVSLGIAFVPLVLASARRIQSQSSSGAGSENVITTLYCLILFTAVVRAVWLLIPSDVLNSSYAPRDVYAFHGEWLGAFISEVLLTAGSISLFSIFILFAIYWSNLVKKGLNLCLFLGGVYSSEGMILMDSFFIALLALVCSIEISMLSHRFRTVLQTLGAVNQVSTETQVKRIVWITVSCNLFFLVRAAADIAVGTTLFVYWKTVPPPITDKQPQLLQACCSEAHHLRLLTCCASPFVYRSRLRAENKAFGPVFDTTSWEWFVLVKHASEAVLLAVILYVLNGSFGTSGGEGDGTKTGGRRTGYQEISRNDTYPADRSRSGSAQHKGSGQQYGTNV
ncbi:hypothetical protein JKP88DRAFT_267140 [Tribonema minus]|uniref:Uncharacterized protein n=1 Tax=Tribonema minus TaxID=303371 RepID=A0A835ZB76_9STRA|nr:hypothetical protein JKP88DRAFT_267140 [Tribonema minus]